ncbi:MAG: Asp23/Gls24 family envelope stress response protein [Coriobacteriia bacterium]|nr:Asp23/Gls24 family envelope stress response protein [Coriobacteriia bacterium]
MQTWDIVSSRPSVQLSRVRRRGRGQSAHRLPRLSWVGKRKPPLCVQSSSVILAAGRVKRLASVVPAERGGLPVAAPHVRGEVTIANDVLADIAGYVALECYGVVGMASPTLRDGVAQLLSRDKLRKGVVITNVDDHSVKVDLYIVAEHRTNLAEVSRNLTDRVRYALTHDADVDVADVSVHVQGIKVRK